MTDRLPPLPPNGGSFDESPTGAPAAMKRLIASAPVSSLTAAHVAELLGIEARLHRQLETELRDWLDGFPPLAERATSELVEAGGKRVRPMLSLLAAAASGGSAQSALPAAVAVELLHTGSLLHDDVIDEGEARRGVPTARSRYGNPLAVLAGDFSFFSAVEVLVDTGDHDVLLWTMDTARQLAEGELMQLERRGLPGRMSVDVYWSIIRRKTAALFAFATRTGARLGGANADDEDALATYGERLGTAFQIVDDVLDVGAEEATFGKKLGMDLARGTATLPLIYAFERRPALLQEAQELVDRVSAGEPPEGWEPATRSLLRGVRETDAIPRATEDALSVSRAALAALEGLRPSGARQSLELLGHLLLTRVG